MPTYEYACRDCGEHVEVVQSFRDGPLTTCGICSGRLRKVFSAAGIIFKGSGYYVTDSRSAPSTASGADKTDGDGAAAKAAGDGDAGDKSGGKRKGDSAVAGDKRSDKPAKKADNKAPAPAAESA